MIESDLEESQDEQIGDAVSTYCSSQHMWLVKSVYAGRPPTIFFAYCPETRLSEQPKH
jgi:hypothetical protein